MDVKTFFSLCHPGLCAGVGILFVIPAYLSSRLSSLDGDDGDDGDERADSTWQLVALVHMATFRWESPFVQK